MIWQHPNGELWNEDVLDFLAAQPDESVQCVVTSPPYWGLRDYGTAEWEGGDVECEHRRHGTHVGPKSTLRNDGRAHKGPYDGEKAVIEGLPYLDTCGRCGATRIDRQIGLEPTPAEYVEKMVAVFAEVRRVLRADGTLWLNMGDGYAASRSGPVGECSTLNGSRHAARESRLAKEAAGRPNSRWHYKPWGLKPKDLIGMPWRVALALQADGWWLRSDIIWAKPNPMPESVTDRPTKAHEYIFLLTKSKTYHYDQEATLEPVSPNTHMRISQNLARQIGSDRAHAGGKTNGPMKAVIRAPKTAAHVDGRDGVRANQSFSDATVLPVTRRNVRTVWEVATQPYPDAHYATFPEKLIEPCVLAGCPEGGIVMDPFAGSGTVGSVASRLGRRWLLNELNPDYCEQVKQRCAQVGMALDIP